MFNKLKVQKKVEVGYIKYHFYYQTTIYWNDISDTGTF